MSSPGSTPPRSPSAAPSSPTSPPRTAGSPSRLSSHEEELTAVPPKTPTKPPASPEDGAKRTPASRLRLSVATSLVGKLINKHIGAENTKDMEGKWLGPVPRRQWMNDFGPKCQLPDGLDALPIKDIPGFRTMKTTVKGEADFVDAIDSSGIFEEFLLWCRDTHELFGRDVTTDTERHFLLSPDISILERDDINMVAGDEERLERLLGEIGVFGDLKGDNKQDPCLHITSPEDRLILDVTESSTDTQAARLVRGQLLTYARAICANSHRTHLYGFVVLPNHARLLYFDRSGVAYSELFNWRDEPLFAEFFQRFALATPLERGIDTSVQKILASDKLVEDAKAIFKKAHKAGDVLPDEITWDSVFKSVKSPSTTYWLCNVYDEATRSFHRVLTYRVHTSSPYFAGRATRGYIGIDIDEKVVAYMKRSWRIDLESFPKERDIYLSFAEPNERGETVPHLPGCYFGGDVPRDSDKLAEHYFEWVDAGKPGGVWTPPFDIELTRTVTADYADTHDNIKRGASDRTDLTDADIEMIPYVLTVTLFNRIGSRLRDFGSTRDLCTAIRDALETHEAAFRLKNVLHRDVSDGNILIAKIPGKKGKVEGLLIDWDLCVDIVRFTTARRKGRTGTWAFMSARMLEKPQDFVHGVIDDLESFCHVVHWHVFHYRHTVPRNKKSDLLVHMRHVFSPGNQVLTGEAGASAKKVFLRGDAQPFTLATESTTPLGLREIMQGLCAPFADIYASVPKKPAYPTTVKMAKYTRLLEEHEATIAEGIETCTHEYMFQVFDLALGDAAKWVGDGPSQDMYTPDICQAFDNGQHISDYYRDTPTGVSVYKRSQADILPKRTLGDEDVFVSATRVYSPGSGRSQTEIPTATGQPAITALNHPELNPLSIPEPRITADHPEASDTSEGARKRQRTI
ncbi:hypothetical protein PENSPDRAFT_681902 [Peniophora sp. CONT]|nr:hypothetical protein PENSPDRAFT_681902 [Peniophora sp. CONT]